MDSAQSIDGLAEGRCASSSDGKQGIPLPTCTNVRFYSSKTKSWQAGSMNTKTNIFENAFQVHNFINAEILHARITEMTPSISVRATGLGKAFRFYENKWHRVRSALLNGGNHSHNLWAVRGVNLELPSGTTLGIIGQNGSGKTTLLQLLAGLLKPSEGQVELKGSLATLLELESGFQNDLTGRENIFISCGLRGFSTREVEQKIGNIIDFAEIDEFINQPVKHYSTGMRMRLAFATAINVQPDVLLIDEIFSVGDMAFQHKCARRFRELQREHTTIVLATHDMTAVKSLCDQAILLDHGKVLRQGRPEDVTNYYLALSAEKIASEDEKDTKMEEQSRAIRHGTGEAKVTSMEITPKGEEIPFGQEATFRFHIEYFSDVPESILGFFIRDRYGNDVVGINTYEERKPIGPRMKGDRLVVEFKFPVYLRPGTYSISPGLSYHPIEPRYLDWINNAAVFRVGESVTGQRIHGFCWIPNEVSIHNVEK
jgi:lipopolysaccharide transport system ATP-binding protein